MFWESKNVSVAGASQPQQPVNDESLAGVKGNGIFLVAENRRFTP
jgi:hypothetical protein